MVTVSKARTHQDCLLTHRTVRIHSIYIVLECRKKLGVRRNDRHILKRFTGRMPVSSAQRNIHNKPLGLNGLKNGSHKQENVVRHTSAVSDHTRSHRLRKCDGETEKCGIRIEQIFDDADNGEGGGCHWLAIPHLPESYFPKQ